MNWVAISLAIIILFLIFIVYYYYTNSATKLTKFLYLTTAQPAITTLSNSSSARYAYGIWIYVNNISNTTATVSPPNISNSVYTGPANIIFQRVGNITLYLNTITPTLYCDLYSANNVASTAVISNNFPIQKWCQIIVNVDGQFVDYYLNGKLLMSEKKPPTNLLAIPSDISKATSNIYIGNSNPAYPQYSAFDAYVSNLQYWGKPIDPQTAWNSYLSGNGQNAVLGAYNLNVQLLKNNMLQNSFSLY